MNGINRRPFQCTRGGLTVRGLEFRGPGESLPVAVVSHGFLANLQSTRRYAEALASWGYAAYCFDFCGGCVVGRSDGRTEDMTVLTEVEDLLAVIDYACSRSGNDPQRVTLMGCSQGGLVSALAAARLRERVERLVLFYPALCIPDDARAGKMMFYSFDPSQPPEKLVGGPITLGSMYPLSVRDMDVFSEISRYRGPVLIVHGDSDDIVAVRYAHEALGAYEATAPRRCQLVVLEGAGHGFRGATDRLALDIVRPFLEGLSLILSVDVKISTRTGFTWTPLGTTRVLPFTGTSSTPWFRGSVLPGARDVQKKPLLRSHRFHAEYDLEGEDYTGAPARVHVINEDTGSGWVPTVTSGAPALSFLNNARAVTVVEGRKSGVLVRIFASTC